MSMLRARATVFQSAQRPRGTRFPPTRTLRALAALLVTACCLPPQSRSAEEIIDSPMYRSPDVFAPRPPPKFAEKIKLSWLGLWLKALDRPEADLRHKAADAIALAHQRGFKGLEGAVAPLVAALDRPDQHA